MTSRRHVSRDPIVINPTPFCREFIFRQSHQKSWLYLFRKNNYIHLCALGVKKYPQLQHKGKTKWALLCRSTLNSFSSRPNSFLFRLNFCCIVCVFGCFKRTERSFFFKSTNNKSIEVVYLKQLLGRTRAKSR